MSVLQGIFDWYVCGPREFYRRNINNFWQGKGLLPVSGEHSFLEMSPLGYSDLDSELGDSMRRTFDRITRKYGED